LYVTNPKRVENHDALLPIVEQILSAKPKSEWLKQLTDAGIPCGDIKTVKEVVTRRSLPAIW
jgi:crotonobetainyl-CoA:carnitine CoA-transferase CaiB-like acyl-CoA transferase